jgi:hypothetical protein
MPARTSRSLPAPLWLVILSFAIGGILSLQDVAIAGSTSFSTPSGVLPNGTAFIDWDVFNPKFGKLTRFRQTFEGGATGLTAAQVASLLARDINITVGINSAVAKGTNVTLAGTLGASIIQSDTTPNFVSLTSNIPQNAPGVIQFQPDPDTGGTVLTGSGSLVVVDTRGLDLSLSAPAGTTNDQFAAIVAQGLSSAVYTAVASGDAVEFASHFPETVTFSPALPGFDVALSSIPEPSSFLTLALGIGGIMLAHASRRR